MPPNVTAAIRARGSRLSWIPLVALVLGVLGLVSGGLALLNGHFTMSLPFGVVLTVVGLVLFIRAKSISNDPVYKVLSNPGNVTGMHISRTNLTAGGAAVSSVDSVVISHTGGGDVWLPVRNVPMEAVVAELRALCPGAAWR
jgi:hypothetical protein